MDSKKSSDRHTCMMACMHSTTHICKINKYLKADSLDFIKLKIEGVLFVCFVWLFQRKPSEKCKGSQPKEWKTVCAGDASVSGFRFRSCTDA